MGHRHAALSPHYPLIYRCNDPPIRKTYINMQGPRLKMMNILAKSAGGTNNSGSVGGGSNAGSVAGSVSAPSPEPRHSPQPNASAQSAIPLGSIALGISASAAAITGSNAPPAVSTARPPRTPDRIRSQDGSISPQSRGVPSAAGGVAGGVLAMSTSGAAVPSSVVDGVSGSTGNDGVQEGRVGGGEGKSGSSHLARSDEIGGVNGDEVAGFGLPPRWGSGSATTSERARSHGSGWVSTALGSAEGSAGVESP